jgi:hypothetical protein
MVTDGTRSPRQRFVSVDRGDLTRTAARPCSGQVAKAAGCLVGDGGGEVPAGSASG